MMNYVLDLILGALNLIYGERWVAPFVIVPAMFLLAAYVRHRAINTAEPYLDAARTRSQAILRALGSDPDPVAERRSFADNYVEVASAMNAEEPGARPLVLAWRQFQESIVDETAVPVRNSTRPTAFFNRMVPSQINLTFASNVFVGAGLILTFLGLIVALNTAAKGMSGGDVNAAKTSLQQLLVVAGAKFFTSVAGLGASIWLRFAEHSLTRKIRHETDQICDLLERGMFYLPPQTLAVDQLQVMREQRDQLKFFNTDMALQLSDRIGEKFTQAIAPVAASINAMSDNMASVTQGIGAGAMEAIEKVSGEQLQGLSSTLANLSERLDAVSQSVDKSSGDAAEQIRRAGEDFAKAASDIREAFMTLTIQVDGMGTKLTEQGEAASAAQQSALASITAGMTGAVTALEEASGRAASALHDKVQASLEQGVKASQDSLRIAFEESGQSLRETTGSLSEAVGKAAQQVERAGEGLGRTGDRAAETADAMRSVTDNARTVATSLGNAAQDFVSAADPVAKAARSVSEAAQQIALTVATDRAADTAALAQMTALAEGVRATQEAAEQAWRDYRARFEAVDRALAGATEKITETLGDSMTQFREFAQKFDSELGSAVSRLGNSLTQLEEYAESLDEYVEEARGLREAAQ
jgi:ABC-type transporter Mla subunit MlaD